MPNSFLEKEAIDHLESIPVLVEITSISPPFFKKLDTSFINLIHLFNGRGGDFLL